VRWFNYGTLWWIP